MLNKMLIDTVGKIHNADALFNASAKLI